MIKPHTTLVLPIHLPKPLQALHELANNYWWCWHPEAIRLFYDIDPILWEQVHRNPVALLQNVSAQRLLEVASSTTYLSRLEGVVAAFRSYMNASPPESLTDGAQGFVAYFCAEFGIHESFSSYSGGLGVLAGDHLKSASDLGLPLVGVGLFYHQGYFHQQLSGDGWQQEVYRSVDPATLPLVLVTQTNGHPLRIAVDLANGRCWAQVWRLQVGRVPLYLLDTNIAENDSNGYRSVTDRLYGGDVTHRIEQEMILGIGGMRALQAMGIEPHVLHINEGHAAFSLFERTYQLQTTAHLEFEEAWLMTKATTVFTTHTPVPAGNEVFDHGTLRPLFEPYALSIGCSWEQCSVLGSTIGGEGFSMTVLGLRGSSQRNGVSLLHGAVAQAMWRTVWPQATLEEVPITGITNGVHAATWVAPELSALFPAVPTPEELWHVHQTRKQRLLDDVHRRTNVRLRADVLTIGFARRFATYKRADLLLHDVDRLARIATASDRPVQIILAGKAHPKDGAGKELIQKVHENIRTLGLAEHVVFVEDYDMDLARLLVRGCDVWLNTPQRPHEASGTSGMKAAMNGVLHFSILDGWWAEAYHPNVGFAIGNDAEFADEDARNAFDASSLYDTLEHEIVPRYYDAPADWKAMMTHSIATLGPSFSATRMVQDYQQTCYVPCMHRFETFRHDQANLARSGRRFQRLLDGTWEHVAIDDVATQTHSAGQPSLLIHASIRLGKLTPDDVVVQALVGRISADGTLHNSTIVAMQGAAANEHYFHYSAEVTSPLAGRVGVAVRLIPRHPAFTCPFDLPHVCISRPVGSEVETFA